MYLGPNPGSAPLTAVAVQIPEGTAGIRETLKIMRRFANEGQLDQKVRELAQSLTSDAMQKDWGGEVRAIHEYVRDCIRYVKDPVDAELVQTPAATIDLESGDCDDKCVLAAALLKSTGHPVRFVAVSFDRRPGELSHVFIETKVGPRWIACELTEPWPTGKAPPNIATRMVKDV